MISKFFSGLIRPMFIMVFAGLLLTGTFPSDAVSNDNTKNNIKADIQPVGIISPDGATNLWPVSRSRGGEILGLLAKYPSKILAGVKFYKLSSWKDMARILTSVSEHQSQVIWELAQGVQQLDKRVGILEKTRKVFVYSGGLNHRVKALEEKVKYMSDGGKR